jgi:hypothetical protein
MDSSNSNSLFEILSNTHQKYEMTKENQTNKVVKLFTNKKLEIQQVLMKYSIEELLNNTVFLLPGKNIIFIDYQVFKIYMVKEIYPLLIRHFIQLLNKLLNSYSTFEVHVNLKSLTISSLQKYSDIFSLFYDICDKEQIIFSKYITKCCLYNVSGSIDAISKLIKQFVDDSVKKTVLFYNEKESEDIMKNIK